MDNSRPVYHKLLNILSHAFNPDHLDIRDDSAKHAGHAGSRPGGETHFRAIIVSDVFKGESRVTRQRRVYAQLQSLMETDIHALQLTILTPDEYQAKHTA